MNIIHMPKLTASEISTLWNTYMADSMAICVLQHFLATVEDIPTREIIEFSLDISNQHIQEITDIFNMEKIPVPNGFGEKDVNIQAKKLYSDSFYLKYLEHMGRSGLFTYSLAKAISSRKDIRNIFKKWFDQTNNLFDQTTDLLQEKGLYIRTPYMTYPSKIEYVNNDKFIGSIFGIGKERPLLGVEIAHIGTNIEVNNVGKTLILGFSQVAQSKKLRKYFQRGYEIGMKHVDVLLNLLKENDTSSPSTWDAEITESTESPFSDQLMLFHVNLAIAFSISNYGSSMGQSLRKDIGAVYARLMTEAAQYAEDGTKLFIENGWMEQPPQTLDRKTLQSTK